MNIRKESYLIISITVLILLPIITSIIISHVDKYQSQKYSQVLDKALATSDDSLCPVINYKEFKDKCFLELGISKNISHLCGKIKDNSKRNSCFHTIAVNIRDITLCERLVGEKRAFYDYQQFPSTRLEPAKIEQCKNEVQQSIIGDAIKSKDYANCKNNEGCEYEIALLLGDFQHCNEFNNSKYNCLAAIAINSKNIDLCGQINSPETKENCIFGVAKVQVNYKLCHFIFNTEKNEECLDYFYCNDKDHMCHPNDNFEYRRKIKLIAQQNSLIECDELPQLAREFCYFEFALKELNPSHCSVLKYIWSGHEGQNYNLQEECYNSVAIYSLNESICTKTTKYKNECVRQVLIEKGQLNITKKVKMRPTSWVSAGLWGDLPATIYTNEGNIYVNSSDYNCYLPGVIMPGMECLTHQY